MRIEAGKFAQLNYFCLMDTKKERLRKYFEGTCTPADMERLFHDLQADSSEEYATVMEEIWEKLATAPAAPDSAETWENIRQRIAAPQVIPMRRPAFRWLAGIAASVLLLAGLGIFVQSQRASELRTFSTAYGETQKIELPDGSFATLNGNSSLRFSDEEANADLREVWLEGEAYFEVERKPGKTLPLARFVVHTRQLAVEVVGTAFNVNERGSKTQVVLHRGEVKISPNQHPLDTLLLQPGQMAEASPESPELRRSEVAAENYVSWTRSELVFEKMPLSEIAEHLEYTYGFSVEFADSSLGDLLFTGRTATDDLDLLWKIVGRAFDLEITQNEHRIWIAPRK